MTAQASPAQDQRPGADQFLDHTSGGDWADRADHSVRTDYSGSDDSDDGDSDDGLDGSDDGPGEADGGHSDDTGVGYRPHPAYAAAPRATRAAAPRETRAVTRRPARDVARHSGAQASGRAAHTRPMSSGEEQYRNGCRQGYIVDDCDQFDVPHLLQRGINPYL